MSRLFERLLTLARLPTVEILDERTGITHDYTRRSGVGLHARLPENGV